MRWIQQVIIHLLRLIMQERLSEGGDGHVNKMHELFQNLLALAIEMKPEFFMCGTMLTILSSNWCISYYVRGEGRESINKRVCASKNNFRIYKSRKNQDDDNEASASKLIRWHWMVTEDTDYKDGKKMFTCFHCNENGHINEIIQITVEKSEITICTRPI